MRSPSGGGWAICPATWPPSSALDEGDAAGDLFLGMTAAPSFAAWRGPSRRASGRCGAGWSSRAGSRSGRAGNRRSSPSRPRPAARHDRRRRPAPGALLGAGAVGRRIRCASSSIASASIVRMVRAGRATRMFKFEAVTSEADPDATGPGCRREIADEIIFAADENASILPVRKVAPALSSPNVPGAAWSRKINCPA